MISHLSADNQDFAELVNVHQEARGAGVDHVQAKRYAQQRYQNQKCFGGFFIVVRFC